MRDTACRTVPYSRPKHSQVIFCYFFFLGLVPLFGIDVWEHAYYLQYKNVRPDYVKSIYKVANWDDVSKRYQQALGRA